MALLVGTLLPLLFLALLLALQRPLRAYLKFRRMELALPGPATLPLIGNTLETIKVTPETVFSTLMDKTSGHRFELSRFSLCGHLFVLVGDAHIIEKVVKRRDFQHKPRLLYSFFDSLSRHGLVTINGAEWQSHRRALLPAFHQHVLETYIEIFSDEAANFVELLVPSQEYTVDEDLMTFSARSFVRTALVSEVDEEHISMMIKFLVLVMHSMMWRASQPLLWVDFVFEYLTETGREVRRLKAKVDRFISDVISRRREDLSRIRSNGTASDADFSQRRRTLIDTLVDPQTGSSFEMSDNEIMDEVKIFFAAAADTTVAVLGWTLKVLSVRPEIQERMHTEITEHLAGKEALTSADISKLTYTEQVIKEAMRLLPSVPLVARAVNADTELGDYKLPGNSFIVLNIYACHRDPKNWPNPLRFDPDRFSPEESANRHPYAYLPFSAGMRNCIGGRYAMLVMKTLLAKLVPVYRVDAVTDGHTEPADFPYTSGVASRMPGGFRVIFTPRQGHSPL